MKVNLHLQIHAFSVTDLARETEILEGIEAAYFIEEGFDATDYELKVGLIALEAQNQIYSSCFLYIPSIRETRTLVCDLNGNAVKYPQQLVLIKLSFEALVMFYLYSIYCRKWWMQIYCPKI